MNAKSAAMLVAVLMLSGCASVKPEKISKADKEDVLRHRREERALRTAEAWENVNVQRRLAHVGKSDLSPAIKGCVLRGQVCIGMTEPDVVASWGDPDQMNDSGDVWGFNSQWVYGDSYLYFRNRKLQSWQSPRSP